MKTKFASVFTVGFVVLAATASASFASMNERPDSIMHGVMAEHTKTVPADRIYSDKDLSRSGYSADAKVEVTIFKSTGATDKSSAND